MSEEPVSLEPESSDCELIPDSDAVAEIAALIEERDRLATQLDEAKDQLLRTVAEMQNVQRRMRQQFDTDRKYGAEPLVRDLIPVLDNFDRTLQAAESGASAESILEGIRAVERQISKALRDHSIERIPAVGLPFDPERHDAVVTVESVDHEDETIIDELESGYTLHDRVIRPAKVRVAKRP